LIGSLETTGKMGTVKIGGDLTGNLFIEGTGLLKGPALKSFTLGGDLLRGSFNINGDVGSITIAGSLGSDTQPAVADQLVIRGNLGKLSVGANKAVDGSEL